MRHHFSSSKAMQLDLFLDGREALFVNDLAAKLLERNPAGAGDALDRLREESPEHPDLGPFDRLVRSLRAGPTAPPGAEQLGPMIESLAALVPAAAPRPRSHRLPAPLVAGARPDRSGARSW